MSFSTFGKRNKLVYFVLHSLNENLIFNEVFYVRDKEQPVLQLACSVLRSLNENFLTVYDVDTSFERINITLNALT